MEPVLEELIAIRCWLQVAKSLNLERIPLQFDALSVVDCNNLAQFSAAFDPIVLDCRLLMEFFRDTIIMFIDKSSNRISHHIIDIDRRVSSRSWLGCIPNMDELESSPFLKRNGEFHY